MTTRQKTIICDFLDQILEDQNLLEKQFEETKNENERNLIQNRHYELSIKDEGIVDLIYKLGYKVGLNDNHKHTIFK